MGSIFLRRRFPWRERRRFFWSACSPELVHFLELCPPACRWHSSIKPIEHFLTTKKQFATELVPSKRQLPVLQHFLEQGFSDAQLPAKFGGVDQQWGGGVGWISRHGIPFHRGCDHRNRQ
jgi:hypothetical protein